MTERSIGFIAVSTLALVVLGGCGQGRDAGAQADVAVTNSYLGAAVRDLCGNDLQVMCLAPPGMCPGHFDISPAQVRQLCDCRMLLLFDFQQKIETNLARLKDIGLDTHLVTGQAGLCVPHSYLAICREVAQWLSDEYPERAADITERLTAIEGRLNSLSEELHASVQQAGASGADILVSNHQVEFARWLGLSPVATFLGSDIETASNIDHCLQKAAGHDIRFVVANLQEGTSLSQALAERLEARAVVFSNFPQGIAGGQEFDALVRNNVAALLAAATP